jgi:ribosome-associated protein
MISKSAASRKLVKLCCQALSSKKAEDLRVLDVSAQSSITDYLVLATGTSEPHLRALGTELRRSLAGAHTRLVGLDAAEESGWTVVDAFDVMVHLLTPAQRERYALENLWKDARDVPVDELLATPKSKPKPKERTVKAAGSGRKKARTTPVRTRSRGSA